MLEDGYDYAVRLSSGRIFYESNDRSSAEKQARYYNEALHRRTGLTTEIVRAKARTWEPVA